MDPGSTPEGIGQAHPAHESSDLGVEPRPPTSGAALPPPVQVEPLTVPTDNRCWLDDHESSFPGTPSASEDCPEGPIEVGESQPSVRRGLQDRELMAKSDVLENQLAMASEGGGGRAKNDSKKADHDSHRITATLPGQVEDGG